MSIEPSSREQNFGEIWIKNLKKFLPYNAEHFDTRGHIWTRINVCLNVKRCCWNHFKSVYSLYWILVSRMYLLNVMIWVRFPYITNSWNPSKHDDVIKWKHFPRNWPFVRGIHRSPVNSSHKGQWRGALMFSLINVWRSDWENNREAGDLRRHRAHFRPLWRRRNECVRQDTYYHGLSIVAMLTYTDALVYLKCRPPAQIYPEYLHITPKQSTLWLCGVRMSAQPTHGVIMTPLLRQNDVAASIWRNNGVVIASRALCLTEPH